MLGLWHDKGDLKGVSIWFDVIARVLLGEVGFGIVTYTAGTEGGYNLESCHSKRVLKGV